MLPHHAEVVYQVVMVAVFVSQTMSIHRAEAVRQIVMEAAIVRQAMPVPYNDSRADRDMEAALVRQAMTMQRIYTKKSALTDWPSGRILYE